MISSMWTFWESLIGTNHREPEYLTTELEPKDPGLTPLVRDIMALFDDFTYRHEGIKYVIFQLYQDVISTIERYVHMDCAGMLKENIFTREVEKIDLELSDALPPLIASPIKPNYGVGFYISRKERLAIVKDYLEERLKGFKDGDSLER